ncbi:MAG: NAD(P)H-dependent glycerol-3-phosphate dehydrogenase [Holosporales bacterium]|jgi:glycerol-3-phosphate dehydrogenase (NAD(P)+)|nr:NAD(P)H-dependent glycerol-3-phosphate dehydrogenase [Holosporales bacterium]
MKLGILGAGAFGTALALVYSGKFDVTLFSCFKDHVDSMNASRINAYFSDFKIPKDVTIKVTSDLNRDEFNCLLWAFPIKPTSQILESISGKVNGTVTIICAKGLLNDGTFMSDRFKKMLPDSKIGYIAGPNFAIDLAKGTLSAADIVFEKSSDADFYAETLSTETFKLYPSRDLVGSQICGAIKNIAAIACGIVNGLTNSQNTQATLLTYALEEMKSLGKQLGAEEKTFYGLCGLGDLMLTAFNETSRNFSLGLKLARGEKIDETIANSKAACEGYDTAKQIIKLAENNNVEMPICNRVYKVLFENSNPDIILDVFA